MQVDAAAAHRGARDLVRDRRVVERVSERDSALLFREGLQQVNGHAMGFFTGTEGCCYRGSRFKKFSSSFAFFGEPPELRAPAGEVRSDLLESDDGVLRPPGSRPGLVIVARGALIVAPGLGVRVTLPAVATSGSGLRRWPFRVSMIRWPASATCAPEGCAVGSRLG